MEEFIKMSELKVLEKSGCLKTVVGSCIALCLWDNHAQVGGMAHIMMRFLNNPSLNTEVWSLRAPYAANSWLKPSVTNAMVVA